MINQIGEETLEAINDLSEDTRKELDSIVVSQPGRNIHATYYRTGNYLRHCRPRSFRTGYEFMLELEQKLPADVNVVTFTSDRSQVTITMNVSTKGEAAATMLAKLYVLRFHRFYFFLCRHENPIERAAAQ